MMRHGTDALADDLRKQRDFVAAKTPIYAVLLDLLVDALDGDLSAHLEAAWRDRSFGVFYERPLLLLAALRYDALREGPQHPLHAAIANDPPDPTRLDAGAVRAAIDPSRARFHHALRTRSVQTNETSRAVTWLYPSHLLYVAGAREEHALLDLGASGGLNLVADALPPLWVDAHGAALEVGPRPPIGRRLGLDLAPVDVRRDDEADWLRACIWPDQHERLARFELGRRAFLDAARGPDAPRVEQASVLDAPARLREVPDAIRAVAYQTIVRDYLPPDVRAAHEAGMKATLDARAPRRALWLELEIDGNDPSPERSAALVAHFTDARGVLRELTLARTHPHPQRLALDAGAIAAFTAAFA
jgi:hypothetical protein